MNLENLLTYNPVQWQIVAHILVLGFAAQAAGFVYFISTMKDVSPKYRTASILGAIVMVSAFLLFIVLPPASVVGTNCLQNGEATIWLHFFNGRD